MACFSRIERWAGWWLVQPSEKPEGVVTIWQNVNFSFVKVNWTWLGLDLLVSSKYTRGHSTTTWTKFWPLSSSSGQLWTFYTIPSMDFLLTPSPTLLFVHIVIKWPPSTALKGRGEDAFEGGLWLYGLLGLTRVLCGPLEDLPSLEGNGLFGSLGCNIHEATAEPTMQWPRTFWVKFLTCWVTILFNKTKTHKMK